MLGQQGAGGLQAMAQNFGRGGLGDSVNSWIGGGPNLPATAANIQQGLGADVIGQLAKQVGVSPQMASSLLAVVLPLVINRLTPQGQIPTQDALGGILGGLLSGRTGGGSLGGAPGEMLGGLPGGKR